MKYLSEQISVRLVMGFISCADDFAVSSDDDEADRLWDDTGEALKEIGLEIDQSKSCNTRQKKTEEDHRTHSFKEKIGKEATEWNSTAADEDDASLAQVRLGEVYEFPGHVEVITQLHFDARKREPPRALDFDAKVVSSKQMTPQAGTLAAKTRDICEKLTERPLQDDDGTTMKLPTSLGGMGIRAATSQLEVSCDTTKKTTKTHAERIERNLTGKQEHAIEGKEHEGNEMWDGTHNIKHDDTERKQ